MIALYILGGIVALFVYLVLGKIAKRLMAILMVTMSQRPRTYKEVLEDLSKAPELMLIWPISLAIVMIIVSVMAIIKLFHFVGIYGGKLLKSISRILLRALPLLKFIGRFFVWTFK